MTFIRFVRAAGLGSISAIATTLVIGAPAALAQTNLPTVDIGRAASAPAAPSAAPQLAPRRPSRIAAR